MFAGHNSFSSALFSKIFNKKVAVILGGTDCASYPSIGYGNFRKQPLKFLTNFSINNSTIVLPLHEKMVRSVNTYYGEAQQKNQGFQNLVENCKTPSEVVYCAFDSQKWYFDPIKDKKKTNSFLVIGSSIDQMTRFYIKGIDLVIKLAEIMPECTFTIVGSNQKSIEKYSYLKNLIMTQWVDDLRELYAEHEYYLQLSISEGMPNTLCESMLCECIPIGSNVTSIPDIIEDAGYILNHNNIEELTSLVTQAQSNSSNHAAMGKLGRAKIKNNYSIEIRASHLGSIIDSL